MSYPDDFSPTSQRAPAGYRDPVRVYESLEREAITALGGVLSGFWGSIEEQVRLAALAGHDYSASQDDRMAVTALGQRALELATRYRDALQRGFAQWREGVGEAAGGKSLSLMSEGELEVHLAGQQTTELLDHQLLHPLELLEERLGALAAALGVQGKRPLPVRPQAAVSAFVSLFGEDDLTPGLRPLVFHQFDKRLPHVLSDLYTKLNDALESAGYGTQPHLDAVRRAPRHDARGALDARAGARHGDTEWSPEGGTVEHTGYGAGGRGLVGGYGRDEGGHARHGVRHAEGHSGPQLHPFGDGGVGATIGASVRQASAVEEGRPPRYRDVVREQLRNWRENAPPAAAGATGARHGLNHARDGVPGPNVLRTEDLLNVAQMLQGDDATPYAKVLGSDARALSRVIREEILGGVKQMGFDPDATHFSVDEEDAIDLVGILFQSLFEANELLQRAHAMYGRLVVPYLKVALTDDSLFNRRSHPARQLLDVLTEACDGNAGDTAQDRETLERAEHAVDRVVEEFEDDQAIFELAATELRDQLDQQRRRSELAEKRAAEAIHGRERLQQARIDADGLVASRMAERTLTAPVAHFLDQHWRHHLTQTWLREGPGSPRHREAIGVGDAMVQVDADAAHARGRAVADQLLALQVPLGACYASCGLDAAGAREAMARIIAALAAPDTARSVHAPEHPPVDVEAEGAGTGLRLAGGTATLAYDESIAARMRRLRVGQGLRLIDEHGHETAARIAWISPLTSRFLVVNRRGVRKLVVSPEELASLVGSGRAVVRSVDAPFDEAMKQVWQHLSKAPASPASAVLPEAALAS
ncbi:MAG TPA: DUF1631 family protein [Luteimonas sp.]|nr:DUF1631 family protein [Luteimonas sp.]